MFEANKAVELFNLRKSQLKKQISDCRKKEFWNKASPRWDGEKYSTVASDQSWWRNQHSNYWRRLKIV